VNRGPVEQIREQARTILRSADRQPGFLLGCGVAGYDCKAEHVQAILEVINEQAH
jgi:hypothetical protein